MKQEVMEGEERGEASLVDLPGHKKRREERGSLKSIL
jgi:hypothetical protein